MKYRSKQQIFWDLVDIADGVFVRFGVENLRKMAEDMHKDKKHPAWDFFIIN